MAVLNGNEAYLSVNSVVVADPGDATEKVFRMFRMSLSTGDENVTAGAGTNWEDHAGKLNVINGTITIVYNTSRVTADLAAISDQTAEGMLIPIIWGPERDVAGKPKHEQNFLVTQINGPEINAEKPLVTFEMTVVSSGEPTSNLYDGDTWSA